LLGVKLISQPYDVQLTRIRKLYNECKEELGTMANTISDETDPGPDSELGQTWGELLGVFNPDCSLVPPFSDPLSLTAA
jgi:hypothetical protein